jgi:hypothetical protein
MYEVEETPYGLRLTLNGFIEQDEMDEYCEKVRAAVDDQFGSFSVVADMRKAEAMPEDSEKQLKELMGYCDEQGLERAAGVFESATTAYQTQRLAENVNHAGGDAVFVDADRSDDWEEEALAWVKEGTEPSSLA